MISQAHLRETESADTAKQAKVEYEHLFRSEWLHLSAQLWPEKHFPHILTNTEGKITH